FMELPAGYEAQVRPRSGLALKHNLTLTNSPGTIDAGYRGEVGVIMFNHGPENFAVSRGDRIAQMVICKLPGVKLVSVEKLSESSRGEGGFGSTGKK
ncbi:MAG: dUTP diphosphatase, partial [Lentisphaeria bacterium]|nr:dUTP diphosphatase [Lentisphaeria bacterium]